MMPNIYIGILVFFTAMVTSMVVYPRALRFARKHHIVDNPNARKLQRIPVPVFGGIVVYSGILVGALVLSCFMWNDVMLYGILSMTIIMAIGMADDTWDLSPTLRLFIEIGLVWAFIAQTGVYIDDFHGMWGVHELPEWLAVSFSILAGVAIINAVNLIDGVDGYSSGYGMMACACLGLCYWSVWSPLMVCMTLLVTGALIPFFMHNVFGQRSRMFIGDGGTLMLGMFIMVCTFYALSSTQSCDKLDSRGLSLTAFTLAVLCIPLFDTLRVMVMRMLRGKSPFKPDKTHLHHLFIDMGFSHLGAAMFILFMNLMVVAICLLLWLLGASVNVQANTVFVLGFIVTFGFYKFMKVQQNSGPKDEDGYPQGTVLWHRMCKLGNWTHREKKRTWRILRYLMDGIMMK